MTREHFSILSVDDKPEILDLYAGLLVERLGRGRVDIYEAQTFEEARDLLSDPDIRFDGMLTDNGFPAGGERVGSKHHNGGAGTQLIGMIRSGLLLDSLEMLDDKDIDKNSLTDISHYQKLPIAWHTAKISDDKVEKIMLHDIENNTEGLTACFRKVEDDDKIIDYIADHLYMH